ncbi:hypothetical protein CF328_g7852, partial [Tilletia controversa]
HRRGITIFSPVQLKKLAERAGWKLKSESVIANPGIQDGRWEVDMTLALQREREEELSNVGGRAPAVVPTDAAFPPPLMELTNALPYIVGPGGSSIRSSTYPSNINTSANAPLRSQVAGPFLGRSERWLQQQQPAQQQSRPAAEDPFINEGIFGHSSPFAPQQQQQQRQQPATPQTTTASYAVPPTPFSHPRDPSLPDTSTLAAADFDIDVRSGFMPPEPPVERLSGVEATWEDMLDRARTLPLRCGGGGVAESDEARRAAWQWRRDIRTMPIQPLSDALANDIRHARRGHLVLAFLAHFYIHSQPPAVSEEQLEQEIKASKPALRAASSSVWLSWLSTSSGRDGAILDEVISDRQPLLGLERGADFDDYRAERLGAFASTIPAALAIPWCRLSDKLDLPPILTYATTVLWNWGLVDPRRSASAPGNLRILTTFTGTRSEEWFYATSALIELRGVEALTLMRRSLDEAFLADSLARRRLGVFLQRLASVIADLERILAEVRRECDPAMFYFAIRPWFRAADDPAGWHYEGVDPPGVRRALTGPSAGQSSLIHALDQFLAIEHAADEQAPAPAPASTHAATAGPTPPSNATFMQRMSLYMPGHHRRFLEHLRRMNVEDSMLESQREFARAKVQAQAQAEAEAKSALAVDVDAVVETGTGTAGGREQASSQPAREEDGKKNLNASSTLHPIRRLALSLPPSPPSASHSPSPSSPAQSQTSPESFQPTPLSRAYDAALYALKSLRDEHMRIATLYIITQARRGAPPEGVRSWLPGSFTGVKEAVVAPVAVVVVDEKQEEGQDGIVVGAVVEVGKKADASAAKGTGGTPLVSFLKECRANTVRAMLQPQ